MSEFPDLDKIVPLKIFCGPVSRVKNTNPIIMCDHAGTLIYNGYNRTKNGIIHRVICSRCGKRFGSPVTPYELMLYQEKLKKVIYEMLFLRTPQRSISVRYKIRPEMLSRFKKLCIHAIYTQNRENIESIEKPLPRGIIFGDETFMGEKGKSHIQIDYINSNYEMLATGSAEPDHFGESIHKVFQKIPETCRKRLKILITDGESTYKDIVANSPGNVLHVVQYHNKKQLGKITLHKYEHVGPHLFHYLIHTHWKIFAKKSHLLKFKWEIKFIKGREYSKRGRPCKNAVPKKMDQKWRQKVIDFKDGKIQTTGTGSVYINCQNKKVSKRVGSSNWMIRMLQPLFPIFNGKVITTGLIESKHHQIKRNWVDRKQATDEYNHELFTISAYLAEYRCLPSFILNNRPLYKYLMKSERSQELTYDLSSNSAKLIQSILDV